MKSGALPAIQPVQKLFEHARAMNVKCIFITSRDEQMRSTTEDNLKLVGYSGYDQLIMKPTGFKGTIQEFKDAEKKTLESKGHFIVLAVGDQSADLSPSTATVNALIPNPFYTTK